MKQNRKTRTGRVVSNKMDKTVVVEVEALKRHPLYRRTVRHKTRFKAHDETNASQIGDNVVITETRPLSKDKRWRVSQILRREELPELPAEMEIVE